MEFLELNGIDKGSINKGYKLKSMEQRWLFAKGVTTNKSDIDE